MPHVQIPLIAPMVFFTAILFSQAGIQFQFMHSIQWSCLFNLEVSQLSLIVSILTLKKIIRQVFSRMSFTLGLSDLPHDYMQVIHFSARIPQKWYCVLSVHGMRRHTVSVCLNTGDVDVGRWVRWHLPHFSIVKILFSL